MYRMILYGLIGGFIGLIVGILMAPRADAYGNTNPWALPTIAFVTLICILLAVVLAYFLNSKDPNSNQITGNRPRISNTTSLLIALGVIIPNSVLLNLFGVWAAVAYCVTFALVGGAWMYYKKTY